MLMSSELKTELFKHIIDSRIDYTELMSKKQVSTKALFDVSTQEFLDELHTHITTDSECVHLIKELEDYVELGKLSKTLRC